MTDVHTATVPAAAFCRAVANAALFASTDVTLPVLCAIRITQGDEGMLRLEATNRYIASREQVPLTDPEHNPGHPGHGDCPPLTTGLDVTADVKQMVSLAKMVKQSARPAAYSTDEPLAVLSHTEGEQHLKVTLTRHLAPDVTFSADLGDGRWPDIGRFFGQHRQPAEPVPGMETPETPSVPVDWAVSAQWLALLAKVDTGGKPQHRAVRFSFAAAPGKPCLVTIGDRFRAVVMTWRTDD